MKLAGITENARHEESRIKGDLKLIDDQYGRKYWNIARTMPTAASCSHVADGTMVEEGGKRFVDEITEVVSVDLVVQGATTSNVFESIEGSNEMDWTKITLKELRAHRPEIAEELIKEGKDARNDEVKKLEEENTTLKGKVDEFTLKESVAKKKAEVEKMLAESKLPQAAKTDVFVEQIMAIDAEDFTTKAKSLIEDRLAIVGGVKHMPAKDDKGAPGQLSEAITSAVAQMDSAIDEF
jgi:hypothetical protein